MKGQSNLEYAVAISLIAIIVLVALLLFGEALSALWENVITALPF